MRLAIAVLLLTLSSYSYGFGRTGHAMVCDMALQLLSAKAQQHVASLVEASPHHEFGAACAWPDEVRSQEEFRWTAPWDATISVGANNVFDREGPQFYSQPSANVSYHGPYGLGRCLCM